MLTVFTRIYAIGLHSDRCIVDLFSTQPPDLWEGVERGGRMWYPVNAHHNGHNLSIIAETLSLSVYEPIAIQFCSGESPPNWGMGLSLGGGSGEVPRKSLPY